MRRLAPRACLAASVVGVALLSVARAVPAQAPVRSAARVEVIDIDARAFPVLSVRMRATDSTGRALAGLTADDLSARLLRDSLPITRVRTTSASDSRPFVQLVIDVSGSVQPALVQLRSAAQEFAQRLGPSVPIGVVLAADTAFQQLAVTTAIDSVRAAIPEQARARRTALWDAVRLAVEIGVDSLPGRRIVLVLSDGRDNASRTPRDSLLALVAGAGTPVFTIAVGTQPDTASLSAVAHASGGEALDASAGSLASVLSRIGELIAAEHTVDISIPSSVQSSGWDSLFLSVRPPGQLAFAATWSGPLLLDVQQPRNQKTRRTPSVLPWLVWFGGGLIICALAAYRAPAGSSRIACASMGGGLWSAVWVFVIAVIRLRLLQ